MKTSDIRIEFNRIILQCKICIFGEIVRKKEQSYLTWTITNCTLLVILASLRSSLAAKVVNAKY